MITITITYLWDGIVRGAHAKHGATQGVEQL
jgi:hypothetical protein